MKEMMVQMSHRLRPKSFKPGAGSVSAGIEDEIFIYAHTGFISAFTNAERFLLLAYRMLNVSERRGYGHGIVVGSCQLGIALDFLPLSKLAVTYHHSGVGVAEALQQPYALGAAYVGLQVHEYYMGEVEKSLALGRRTIQIYRQTGDLEEWGFATAFFSLGCYQACNFTEGLAYSQELIRVGQDAGLRALWCWGEARQGKMLRRQGKLEEAIASQQKAIELAKAIPDYIFQTISGTELALCHLRQGDWKSALTQLEESQRIAAEHQVLEPYSRAAILNGLAETYLFVFEHGELSEKSAWLNKAKRACRNAAKTSSVCQPLVPKAMRLQGAYEWLSGNPTAAQKWWQKSLAEAERMNLRYDIGEIHLEMGTRLGERVHLEKAESIFAEIGAELELVRTRELLRR